MVHPSACAPLLENPAFPQTRAGARFKRYFSPEMRRGICREAQALSTPIHLKGESLPQNAIMAERDWESQRILAVLPDSSFALAGTCERER
jgi:hypothetical protein